MIDTVKLEIEYVPEHDHFVITTLDYHDGVSLMGFIEREDQVRSFIAEATADLTDMALELRAIHQAGAAP